METGARASTTWMTGSASASPVTGGLFVGVTTLPDESRVARPFWGMGASLNPMLKMSLKKLLVPAVLPTAW